MNIPTLKAPDLEEFKVLLKRHKMKATNQRLAVHQVMLKLGHASADQVAQELTKEATTKFTVASVYNILTQLSDCGIYQHRLSSNNKMYFDVNNFKHMHLYDYENNRYQDVFDSELMDMIDEHLKKRRFKGYTVEGIDIQLICRPTSRKRSKSE